MADLVGVGGNRASAAVGGEVAVEFADVLESTLVIPEPCSQDVAVVAS